ncbi:MAG: hypothetical protein CFE43_21125 [Burkholderiales bacterium PBB3]|nr:MAG: hypothetical protein CFE43_21125 [Burkholderiales bacterium PBB3]
MSAVAKYLVAGWEICDSWPESFTSLLVRLRQPPSAEITIQSFREAFPGFLRVLTGLRNQGWRARVLDSVTAYTSSTHGTSQAIHGREAFHESGLSQSTVARSLGVSTTTLTQMLRDDASLQHLRRTTSGGRTRRLISEATITSLKHGLHDRISEKAAASMLGLKPIRVQHLLNCGFLVLNKGLFSADQVQEFTNRIVLEATPISAEHGGWIPLVEALRLHIPNHLTDRFFGALVSKSIRYAAPAESTSLRSLVIHPDHLSQWRAVELDADAEWLTIPETACKLGLKEQVTYELVSLGLLKCERRRLKSRMTRAISADSISFFEQNYVSLSNLLAENNVYPKNGYAWALDAGLCVVSGPLVDGTRQYFVKRAYSSPRKS